MIKQRTLKTTVRATGVGLHTGHKVAMALRPAPVDTGIVFCRSDLPGQVRDHFVRDPTRVATGAFWVECDRPVKAPRRRRCRDYERSSGRSAFSFVAG